MTVILLYSIVYLGLFFFTDFLYHKFSIPSNTTRKIVHVVSGLIALTFPIYFKDLWQVVVITLSFLLLLALSEKKGWFKSITAVERSSWGSWLYPLAILVCFIAMRLQNSSLFFYVLVLTLALSDTFASVVGRHFPKFSYAVFGNTKTWIGSLVFFITTFLITIFFLKSTMPFNKLLIFAISITAVEAFSYRGVDNLTIPLSCIILLNFFI